ncbi:WD40 repeat domain-containing protein [Marinoscillum sp. MHG1-6]|uniref:WD40 repeat domain-containing protein n=1 Tax=Marinoscillum sp. MHG1-6 TaxID=2959627 RepID=UPI002157407D|nr:WD40 repeat domain-containing protein [Marinoscillum sp. MHG1-6]
MLRKPIQVQKIRTLSGHKEPLYTLQPLNGSQFLSAGGDGMVVRWDLDNPEVGQMIVKVPASVYAMEYNEPHNLLVVGQNFSGVHLIDVENKSEVKSVALTSESIFDIQSSQEYIYVGAGDGELIVLDWDLNIVTRKKLSPKSIRAIAINQHKSEMAVGYSDHKVRILSMDDYKVLHEIEAHSNSVFSLCYHPELPLLLSAGRDARIKFWDTDNEYKCVEEIVAHMYTINHLTFSPDRQHFVSCSMDKSIKVWDAQTFKLLKVIDKARHAGHGTSVNKLLWLNHKETLVSCSDDRTISLWDINFAS